MVRSDPNGVLTESASWVVRVASSPCDVNNDGVINVIDVQVIVDQVLGLMPPISDLNGDGNINVVDVMIVVNAALGLGCPG